MILLSAESIVKHFGPEPVLEGVTFDIRTGERIGLVGPNGTGKTTLFNILAGLLDADSGKVMRREDIQVGFLQQHVELKSDRPVWDEAIEGLGDLVRLRDKSERLAHQIAEESDEQLRRRLAAKFDAVQEELTRRDGFAIDHKVQRVLQGVGLPESMHGQAARLLSGGQQNRLLLAKLLLAEPDVLLLDEPSNHLDLTATEWLEDYLVSTDQTLIVVSHDRYFLDKVTSRTLELYHATVESYRGNFTAYWRQKSERVELQKRTHENQQQEIAKLRDFVRRHHHGQKHAQAEDRRKKLERIVPVAPPRVIEQPYMQFPSGPRTGDIVLRIEGLAKAFDEQLFADLSFDILRGERWAVLGANGTGKTTLLRCLLDEEPPSEGNIIRGTGVVVGYFDQQLRQLPEDAEVVEAVRPPHDKPFNQQQRRDALARFGIIGDMAYQKVESLSGGERNRVALARLAATEANVLILDEPTNHLDLWARAALEEALRDFDGTVIFVSHDRYFVNQVADHALVLQPGKHRILQGSNHLLDKLRELDKQTRSNAKQPTSSDAAESSKKATPSNDKPRRKRKFRYRKLEDLEADIVQHENQVARLQQELIDPDVLRDGRKVKAVQAEIAQQQKSLESLYEHWEEAAELN